MTELTDKKLAYTKLAYICADGRNFYAAINDKGAIDLTPHFPDIPDLKTAIAQDKLPALLEKAENQAITHKDGNFQFNVPIHNGEKIICVGVNFPDRNAEYKDGIQAPDKMSLFIRFARSFSGHQQPIIRPKASDKLDYEGEMVVVIGKGGRHISAPNAPNHIAALSICNEGTLRDWVRHAKFNVTQGKNFDNSGALGPWLVPFTDIEQIENAEITTYVNGEMRQNDNTSRMIFPICEQIAYISTFTTLVAGDMIITGTPTGAGARFDPPIFLKPDDEIKVEISNIGVLRNIVADEK
ncbi:MAG: fumarylacetoacetate hydrolase family protein [Alphaproteobacteria bacterium]|nr:fumarylacetoacetate hydrolase family protein [Alphaproteobacteria bacterium]